MHVANEERLLGGLNTQERAQLRQLLGQLAAYIETDGTETEGA